MYHLKDDGATALNTVADDVIRHYDLLIDENNDPVHDAQPLREYMERWDGQVFIDKMELAPEKAVLEIGVGTGRLAMRTSSLCGHFFGADISPKTIERAKENLSAQSNVTLFCGDFFTLDFPCSFDVIYSSLTWMHLEHKQQAVDKVAALLKADGKFVLSIDKSQAEYLDYGTRIVKVFPDSPNAVKNALAQSGLRLTEQLETPCAFIFVAIK